MEEIDPKEQKRLKRRLTLDRSGLQRQDTLSPGIQRSDTLSPQVSPTMVPPDSPQLPDSGSPVPKIDGRRFSLNHL